MSSSYTPFPLAWRPLLAWTCTKMMRVHHLTQQAGRSQCLSLIHLTKGYSSIYFCPGSVQHEVSLFGEYLGRNTSGSSLNSVNRKKKTLKYCYSWVVKLRNTSKQYLGHNTPLGHYPDRGFMVLGQYNRLEVLWPSYCLCCGSFIIRGYGHKRVL